jgi:hypothetical protein
MTRWEIGRAIEVLERAGYVVRRPSEVSLPVTLEVPEHQRNLYAVDVRVDALLNGQTCCISQSFPPDLLLNPDDNEFRTRDLPLILSRKLSQFMADSLAAGIAAQVKTKIEPLVPEKRMSLHEIESYLEWALRDCRAEKEPTEPERPTER